MWCDEPNIESYLDSKASLTDFFVTYPEVDRLLFFAIKQFINESLTCNAGLLITGPRFSGKSTIICVIFIFFLFLT